MNAGIWWSWWRVVVMSGIVSTRSVCCSHFTDHYAVQVDGGIDEAQRVAMEHGFVFVNEVHCILVVFVLLLLWGPYNDCRLSLYLL